MGAAVPLALDPVALAAALIRCPSVTPAEGGALTLLQQVLEPLGFVCHRLIRGGEDGGAPVDNLYARLGTAAPQFCFAGHTDVVPAGGAWTRDPFGGEIADGRLHGRGAVDMKGAIAAFVAAVARHLDRGAVLPGSVSLLITGDEEGPAVNGTVRVLDWLRERGALPDACLVGEPTNPDVLGEAIKIGRRGSLSAVLTVFGTQGHVAYPHLADNPLPRLVATLAALTAAPLDGGSDAFEPSSLALTTIDTGNAATNVIPAEARAGFNIRFNDRHSGAGLAVWLREICARHAGAHDLQVTIGGEAFLTAPGPLTDVVAAAVAAVTGRTPRFSTSGGTSDARFIRTACPVVEFGLVGRTMHKSDEHVAVADIEALTAIYGDCLTRFFARSLPGGTP